MSKTKQAPVGPVPPRAITLIGNGVQIMQQATILIRSGYFPDPASPVMVFPEAGKIQMQLIPGTPEQAYADAAAVTLNEASQREQAQYERDVAAEADRRIEVKAAAEKLAQREALIAAQREALAALEAQQ